MTEVQTSESTIPAEDSKPDTKPVLFISDTEMVRSSYYRGYHDAFKDVLAVALIYALALYMVMRYATK